MSAGSAGDTTMVALLADDDPDIRTLVTLALSVRAGWELHCCASGEELLARAVEVDPDLVVLDLVMPGLDGEATLARLRRLPGYEARPVVFLTARTHPDEVARLRARGAAGVVAKPFDPRTLDRALLRAAAGEGA